MKRLGVALQGVVVARRREASSELGEWLSPAERALLTRRPCNYCMALVPLIDFALRNGRRLSYCLRCEEQGERERRAWAEKRRAA